MNLFALARFPFQCVGAAIDLVLVSQAVNKHSQMLAGAWESRLVAAEAESEDTPYCNGCGRPHGAGECGRDKAEPVKPTIESLFQAYWDAETPEVETQALNDIDRYYPEWGRYSRPIPDSAAGAGADVSPAVSPAGGAGPEGLSHSPRDPSGPPNVTAEDLVLAASIVYGYAILPHVSSGKAVEYTALADRLSAAATP